MEEKMNKKNHKSIMVDINYTIDGNKLSKINRKLRKKKRQTLTRKQYNRHKKRFSIWLYKQLHGCIYCNTNKRLTFHHSFDKKDKVTRLIKSSTKMWQEVYKCEVICRKCHDRIDNNVKSKIQQHKYFSPYWIIVDLNYTGKKYEQKSCYHRKNRQNRKTSKRR